ncbi:MAG: response regulator [Archangium sp.]|nr:response regulator [Archangium sp.]
MESTELQNALLSPHDLAAMTEVSVSTIRRWIDQGLIPARRTAGNHRRVAKSDALAFIKRRGLKLTSPSSSGRTRVLVIDDDAGFLRSLKALLEREQSLEVDIAENATHGLLLTGVRRPDVVLLDAMMEGLDGFEFLRRMKEMPETAAIRILGMSGDPRAEARFRKEGVDAFLTKPFSTRVVVELLRVMGLAQRPTG